MDSYEHVPGFSTLSEDEKRKIQLAATTEAIKSLAYWLPTLIQLAGFACVYFFVPRGQLYFFILIAYIALSQWPMRWFNRRFVGRLISKRLALGGGGA